MDAQRAGGGGRIAWLDRARGLALAGMVLFHATFDREMAGLVAAGTTRAGVTVPRMSTSSAVPTAAWAGGT
jgi:uncharacterized membrane protein